MTDPLHEQRLAQRIRDDIAAGVASHVLVDAAIAESKAAGVSVLVVMRVLVRDHGVPLDLASSIVGARAHGGVYESDTVDRELGPYFAASRR